MIKNILISLGLIGLGGALCYFTIWQTYQEMASGAQNISIGEKSMVFAPVLLATGAFMLLATVMSPMLGGDVSQPINKQGTVQNGLVILGVVLGLAAGLYIAFSWMPDQERKYGYIEQH